MRGIYIPDIRKQRRRKRAARAKKFASSTGGQCNVAQANTTAVALQPTTEGMVIQYMEFYRVGRKE